MDDSSKKGDWEGKHIVVTTPETLFAKLLSRDPFLNLSGLHVIVIDEVDFFFTDSKNAD